MKACEIRKKIRKLEKIRKNYQNIFLNNGNGQLNIHIKYIFMMYLISIIYIRYTDYIYVTNTIN